MHDFTPFENMYKNNPVAFMRNVIGYEPDEWQAKVAMAIAENKRVTVRSGQGVGKTALAATIALWFLTLHPNCRVICTAPTLAQLSDVLWAEMSKQRNRSPFLLAILNHTKTKISVKKMTDTWFCVAKTAVKPENMQGFHEDDMLFIVDEASGIKDDIMEAILGTLTGENNKLAMFGNPTKRTGIFYDSHHGTRGKFITHRVNAEDSHRTSKENIESLAESYGKDSNVYRVRVLGEFPIDDDDVLISLPLVESAINEVEPDTNGSIVFGVDVARYGDDKTIIARKQGNKIDIPVEKQGQDLMRTVGDIVALYHETLRENKGMIVVNVDDTGLGGGVTDRLREVQREQGLSQMEIIGTNFGARAPNSTARKQYDNMGAYLWSSLKGDLLNKNISLPNDTRMVAELTSRKYVMTSSGRIALESKDALKKRKLPSPDKADAIVLANYGHNLDYIYAK